MKLFHFFTVWLVPMIAMTQITLENPSFEDKPSDATVPHGWWPCEEGTTPDILPGYWGVYGEPSEGETYVGLITRTNNTWESIGQRFSQKLEQDACYIFSIDLALSKAYAGYGNGLKLRIWIGEDKCAKDHLIFESPRIEHTEWKSYDVKFNPNIPAKYIILEAFHQEGPVNYRGNILLDNATSIKYCGRA